jgi:hypothetical protein
MQLGSKVQHVASPCATTVHGRQTRGRTACDIRKQSRWDDCVGVMTHLRPTTAGRMHSGWIDQEPDVHAPMHGAAYTITLNWQRVCLLHGGPHLIVGDESLSDDNLALKSLLGQHGGCQGAPACGHHLFERAHTGQLSRGPRQGPVACPLSLHCAAPQ